ncbi:MAG: MazG nucleotide pyrophosphohydrolase domain-containing protein [Dehalococcoidia bacterium]
MGRAQTAGKAALVDPRGDPGRDAGTGGITVDPGRARRIGFDWPDIEGPLEKLSEELHEFARAEAGDGDREDEFGDILFVLANIAQRLGLDAEQALRGANAKFRRRFGLVEELARERAVDLRDLDLAGLDALWDEAKARLAGTPPAG